MDLVQASAEISRSGDVDVQIVSAPMIKRFSKVFLIMFFTVGSSVVFCLMLNEWMQNPNQRSWFLLGSAFLCLKCFEILLERTCTGHVTIFLSSNMG